MYPRRLNVVVGPPCSGKTTHLQRNAGKGDVLVDLDVLAWALEHHDWHDATGRIKAVALATRAAAITELLRDAKQTGWIIDTNPTPEAIARYEANGAHFIVCDPGAEVCLERAALAGRPARVKKVIEDWYANPPKIPEPEYA